MSDTFTPRLDILPKEQRDLWPQLKPVQRSGFVLYGGTAIALRLGHRKSVDFDFFTSRTLDKPSLRASLPFLKDSTVRQDSKNTFEVVTSSGVKVSFFGDLTFGRVERPQMTEDRVVRVASIADLMATKLKVLLQRTEAKDYQDLAAMVRSGASLEVGLAAAQEMYKPTFAPAEAMKAAVYFQGGDLNRVSAADRIALTRAIQSVSRLPAVTLTPNLDAPNPTAAVRVSVPSIRIDRSGPRMGF